MQYDRRGHPLRDVGLARGGHVKKLAAVVAADEAVLLKRADRLANGRPIDVEALGQGRFRRQAVADRPFAAHDFGLDDAHHHAIGGLAACARRADDFSRGHFQSDNSSIGIQ